MPSGGLIHVNGNFIFRIRIAAMLGIVLATTARAQTEAPADIFQEDPAEFSAPSSSPEEIKAEPATSSAPKQKRHGHKDENIDYGKALRGIQMEERPKPYRHHYLGAEGWRPSTLSLSVGGRTPGYGGFFDYSWNRVGIGVSGSYRPVERFVVIRQGEEYTTNGQIFANAWIHYNLIPYPVSPYVLGGLEFADGAETTFAPIAGIGVEARLHYGITFFVEYVRHETVKKGFAGAALGVAF